ncbi:MAG: preprotein translocase subunit SecE [Verrucomicrobia bacterium GWC2_42_7]|nr:MAG: preprotein translocase subunit SecE [Verrucomicrobia bacterium GWC2_42_7]
MRNPFTKIRIFGGELVNELKKASWPDKIELRDSTLVVVIGIALLGVYVSVVDFSLFQIVNLLSSIARS